MRAPAGDGRRGPAAGLRRRHAERRRRLGRSGRRQRRPQRGVRDLALRTLAEAWRRVPAGTALSQGVRINLAAGTYPESALPAYWENRRGTFAAPVIVRAADGPGTARLPTVNVFDCHHLRFEGLEISAAGGDCERRSKSAARGGVARPVEQCSAQLCSVVGQDNRGGAAISPFRERGTRRG
ncbi:MAG: hypothetical protein FJ284_16030, partial [Planctomycetes bacterium]|nr:hypothetical protein [Planctomycetota bacterium]